MRLRHWRRLGASAWDRGSDMGSCYVLVKWPPNGRVPLAPPRRVEWDHLGSAWNDAFAPIPAVRTAMIDRLKSTQTGHPESPVE